MAKNQPLDEATQQVVKQRLRAGDNPAQIAQDRDIPWALVQQLAKQVRLAANGQGEAPPPTAATVVEVPLTEEVPLADIDLLSQFNTSRGITQARENGLDQATVEAYAEAMRVGATFPAVVLFMDEAEVFWIGDGYHRLAAAQHVGAETISAEVRAGGRVDALLYACQANTTHGKPRTNADKRRAVLLLLREEACRHWSNGRLAKACAVSDELVRDVKGSLPTAGSDDGQRTYINRYGHEATMDTTRIGFHREAPAPTSIEVPPREAPDREPVEIVVRREEAPPSPPARPVDLVVSLGYLHTSVMHHLALVEKQGGYQRMTQGWTAAQREDYRQKVADIADEWGLFADVAASEESRRPPEEAADARP